MNATIAILTSSRWRYPTRRLKSDHHAVDEHRASGISVAELTPFSGDAYPAGGIRRFSDTANGTSRPASRSGAERAP